MTRNESDSRRWSAESRGEDQLSAGTSPLRLAEEKIIRELSHSAERQGRKLTADWIGHPQTKPVVLCYRWHADGILGTPPVDRFTYGDHAQGAIYEFTESALQCFAERPDGTISRDVILDPVNGWQLTYLERYAAWQVASHWRALLAMVAGTLRGLGVPIDASFTAAAGDRRFRGDLFPLAELLALPIDLDADPEYLVEEVLNTSPPLHFGALDHQLTMREVRGDDCDRTAMRMQRHRVTRDTGRSTFPAPRLPDPKVYTSAPNWPTRLMELRRAALAEAHRTYKGRLPFIPAEVRRSWGRGPTQPGGAVSTALDRLLAGVTGEDGEPRTADKPSLATIRRDFQACGIPFSPAKARRR